MFSFCFAVTLGVLWEIYEFSVDYLFGWNMQRSGINDTMTDLMVDALGAFAVSLLGYLYMKGDIKAFERIEKSFIRMNRKRKEPKEEKLNQ